MTGKINPRISTTPALCGARNLACRTWPRQLFSARASGRLSGIDVARVVKKLVDRAGFDASQYAGHSLRAGHATSAAIAGASERSIMNQTGHRSVQMVSPVYSGRQSVQRQQRGETGL
jgi:integrase